MSAPDPTLTPFRDRPLPTPLGDAIEDIGKGGDGFDILVKADEQDASVGAAWQKGLGKGWTWAGAVSYAKEAAWAVWTGLSWRPKAK